ncbi:MAG: braE [Frankiales bacterium]|nr:braE [Frankiales bacterium]
MSDAATTTAAPLGEHVAAPTPARRRSGKVLQRVLLGLGLALLLVAPLYVDEFWLRTGFAAFGAIIGAIGLNLLVGNTGQLSLAHAFFLAVGAITYCFVSGQPSARAEAADGLGWPPLVGMVLGVLFAGFAGLLFSPIAARLRGIYLGVASLGLVFIGQHVLNTWKAVTGGFNGRNTPRFELFGFAFDSTDPTLYVLNVQFNEFERLWYLGLFLAVAAFLFARNLLRGRPGRALMTLRDSEVAAAVMGVNVQRYKARVFLVSSMYAGLSGVLYALLIGSVAPESFALDLSVLYLAMIVLGGLGSVSGAVIGAVFVSSLPIIFQEYAGSLPFISEPGQGGVSAGQAARLLFGLAIVLVVLFQPTGLVGLTQRFRRTARPAPTATSGPRVTSTATSTSTSTSTIPLPTTPQPPAQGSTS